MTRRLIQTWRSGNKPGVIIPKAHYDQLKLCILELVKQNERLELNSLIEEAQRYLSIPVIDFVWMLLQVKQDLEARGLIRIKFVGPDRTQVIKLRKRGRSAVECPN